mgnify:FL=1
MYFFFIYIDNNSAVTNVDITSDFKAESDTNIGKVFLIKMTEWNRLGSRTIVITDINIGAALFPNNLTDF